MAACSFSNERLKLFRQALDLTQTDLAIIANVSRNCVSDWENGLYQPKFSALNAIICYGIENGSFTDYRQAINYFFGG